MALVEQPARAVIKFMDRDKNTATTTVYYDPSLVEFAAFYTYLTTVFIPRITAVSNAKVMGVDFVRSVEEDDLTLPVEASDVERKLVLSFKVDGGGNAVFAIPSVDNTYIIDGTVIVDPANAAISNLVNGFLQTGIADFARLRNYRGDELLELNQTPYKKHYSRRAKG